jgi:hypothetical protein
MREFVWCRVVVVKAVCRVWRVVGGNLEAQKVWYRVMSPSSSHVAKRPERAFLASGPLNATTRGNAPARQSHHLPCLALEARHQNHDCPVVIVAAL